MSLWTSAAADAATGGVSLREWSASGVSIDTRSLQKGDLFVALQDVRDGHDFVAAALAKGASAALVSRVPDGVPADAPLLIVDDVLKGLEALGAAARQRTDAKVIAVTGSVGKTGTKEMLRSALTAQGRVHAAEKSYNNHWGVPLTLARMPEDTQFGVFEIGMNHPGEIGPLSRMVRPDVAVITNVAAVHMEAFASVAEIALEKAAVIDGMESGTIILNADLDTFDVLAAQCARVDVLTFGTRGQPDFTLQTVTLGTTTTEVNADIFGQPMHFEIGGVGTHLAMNGLAVLAAVHAIGGDVSLAVSALADWRPPMGRGARWQILQANLHLIDDSYNANPLSMAAALDVLAHAKADRRVAILGDMLELGPSEHSLHRQIADIPSLAQIDQIHCVGLLMKTLYDALPPEKQGIWVATSAELQPQLQSGDTIMVKGSLGAKMGLIVDAIKKLGDARPMNNTEGES